MTHPEPNITIKVDVTNPGQFFACCGLLELADRLWLAWQISLSGWLLECCALEGGFVFGVRRLAT
jgi:CRISPR-associated protein Csb3